MRNTSDLSIIIRRRSNVITIFGIVGSSMSKFTALCVKRGNNPNAEKLSVVPQTPGAIDCHEYVFDRVLLGSR